jgi:hypothetical protein
MRAEIWTRGHGFGDGQIPPLHLWSGDIPAVPGMDTRIEVWEGWAAVFPEAVIMSCTEDGEWLLTIELPADRSGEYAAELERRAATEQGETR